MKDSSAVVVLYVEDEESDVIFMRRAFHQVGGDCKLYSVNDGCKAIAWLKGEGTYSDRNKFPVPSLILLDINLPGCSGFDILHWVRQQTAFETLPVILFSSSARPDDQRRAEILGATDYFAKPSSGIDFVEVVRGLLDRWVVPASKP
ncbi:MAG: response regulator [Limisphaerales bacterium]